MSEASRPPRAGTWAYLTVTAIACVLAAGLVGGFERTAGVLGAWAVQAVAFWLLDARLAAGRDALKVWAAGLAGRLAGLGLTGGLALTGVASLVLPASYGIAMLGLLLTEAIWLARHLEWPDRADPARTRH